MRSCRKLELSQSDVYLDNLRAKLASEKSICFNEYLLSVFAGESKQRNSACSETLIPELNFISGEIQLTLLALNKQEAKIPDRIK